MPPQQRPGKVTPVNIFLGVLAVVYLIYLGARLQSFYPSLSASAPTISEHVVDTNPNVIVKHWTLAHMRDAIDIDQQMKAAPSLTGNAIDISRSKAAKQKGQNPRTAEPSYPLSTVGKVFFNKAGQDYVCSGTVVASSNRSVVDTAGHCLYLYGNWAQNVIFCPLYDNGSTPYGCWAARDLEVPSDWIDAGLSDLHHDFGMAIVAPNDQGALTDQVGGAGWAYNQPVDQQFYAYGYPAAYPFDGQTRRSCDASIGKAWPHGGGTVVSIPCDMTGGSSGGPWFIKIGSNWYLNGHNDFGSSLQPGHMFSPYYDDTWYALYNKAQRS